MGADPMTALTIASAVTGTMGKVAEEQANANEAQARYNEQVAKANAMKQSAQYEAEERNNEALLNYNQLQAQEMEANTAAAGEKGRILREAAREREKLRVSAGESGVSGISVERLLRGVDMDATTDVATIEANRKSKISQAEYEKQAVQARAKVAPVSTYVGSKPSGARTGLALIDGGLNGAAVTSQAVDKYGWGWLKKGY